WLVPYTSPNAANVPASLKSETAVTQGVSALGIAWNPKSGTPKPEDWGDLAKPAFKNLVTVPDPAQSGSSFDLVAGLAVGAGNLKLFEDLKANGAVLAAANADALNPVLQGAKAAVFGAVDYISLAQQKSGESIEVLFPSSETVVAPRPMMILKWTKHKEDAERFIDYVLSDEGQAEVAKVHLIPGRSDIKADRPLMQDITLLPVDDAALEPKRKDILAQFSKIFGH
ncbi:MAG TPA: extracellular solute-binding protein, partial [Beijerinckiaceae bacterium]|nr:extracellular solute-binding protein [Beijerinckiaceae bacterium]